MTTFEDVEKIVVGALAQQDRYTRRVRAHFDAPKKPPDSRVVTREIIEVMADALESVDAPWTNGNRTLARWLRAAAEESEK